MTREANVLVLCANIRTIKEYKCLEILQRLCVDDNVIKGCKYWTSLNLYYAGMELAKHNILPTKTTGTITPNTVMIPGNTNTNSIVSVSHNVLPDELGNIKKNNLEAVFPKFFDLVINENCPRSEGSGFAITPKDLFPVINECMKLDGYYIDKEIAREHFGSHGFQLLYKDLLKKESKPVNITAAGETANWVVFKFRTVGSPKSREKSIGKTVSARGVKKGNKKSQKKRKKRKYHH